MLRVGLGRTQRFLVQYFQAFFTCRSDDRVIEPVESIYCIEVCSRNESRSAEDQAGNCVRNTGGFKKRQYCKLAVATPEHSLRTVRASV